jgi:GT2 family glycosyltransferase
VVGVQADQRANLTFAAGTALILRRAAYDEVGGFDESYFLYSEDADLCRALVWAGWRVQYEPTLAVEHLVGASANNFRRERVEAVEGLLWYWQKQSPARRRIVQAMAVVHAAVLLALQFRNRDNRYSIQRRLLDLYRWQPHIQERHRARTAAAAFRQVPLS